VTDLEIGVTGHWRSLKISLFDTAHATSYWRSIVTMALSHVVSEIFNVEKCRDLEIGVPGHWNLGQGHWKWYHSIDCLCFLLMCYSNFVPKRHRFWDIRLQKCCDLENRVRGQSMTMEMSTLDRAHTTSYWRSIATMALSSIVSEIFNVEKCRDLQIRVRG